MKTAKGIMKKKAFIKETMDKMLGKEKSDALWDKATVRLDGILREYERLPKGVRVHTDGFIFPSAAIYLSVKEELGEEVAYRIVEKAAEVNSTKIGNLLGKVMKIPRMDDLFIAVWNPMTKKMFGKDNGFENAFYPRKKDEYRMDVTVCPYCRYFRELGCFELTKIFCGNDERVYGNLPKIAFERSGTLGMGADRCDFCVRKRPEHVQIDEMPYGKKIKKWLRDRYGEKADGIWRKVEENYATYLDEIPDYGGKKNGHAKAIYGGLLVFAWHEALPERIPLSQLQTFVNEMFFGGFTLLGKVFDLNRARDMWLIDKIFRKSGDRDRRDIQKYPDGFVNVDEAYDDVHHVARYSFTQCPNAVFAKEHGLLHVLPLLCNSDYYGISQLHGSLIRCGTCGISPVCDYCVVGDRNIMAKEYVVTEDEMGFLVSRKKIQD